MLPASDLPSGGNDAGGPAGGGQDQRPPPPDTPKLDSALITKLLIFHKELCPIKESWIRHKPATETLDKLVNLSDDLFKMFYEQYRPGRAESVDQAKRLENLSDMICLAAFALGDMRDADGNITPEDRLKLHKRLLALDVILEYVLSKSGNL